MNKQYMAAVAATNKDFDLRSRAGLNSLLDDILQEGVNEVMDAYGGGIGIYDLDADYDFLDEELERLTRSY